MSHLIDKDALVAEIENYKNSVGEDFESEWKRYCDSKGGGAVTMNIKDVAKHFFTMAERADDERRNRYTHR